MLPNINVLVQSFLDYHPYIIKTKHKEQIKWQLALGTVTLEYAQLTVSFENHELDMLVYQQGQEGEHLICQTARIPICAKVTWHSEIKADENGLFEY